MEHKPVICWARPEKFHLRVLPPERSHAWTDHNNWFGSSMSGAVKGLSLFPALSLSPSRWSRVEQ